MHKMTCISESVFMIYSQESDVGSVKVHIPVMTIQLVYVLT